MIDDSELLQRYAANRSEAAFADLVQRHLNLVYFAALRRTNGDAHLAEEVTQLVFSALAQNAARLQRHTVLTGWLYVTTRHVAANAMRAEQRRKTREQEAYTMQELSPMTAPEADWNQLRPELDAVLDELNEPDRNVVLLRFFENRPFADIGTTLRVSEDAARMRVDRALGKLRTQLRKRGITLTTAALAGMLASQSAVAAPAGLAATVTGAALTGANAATVGTATALNLLNIMSTTKIMAGIAGAVAFMAAGTAVYEFRESHQNQERLATVSHERDGLRAQLQRLETQAREAEEKIRLAQARSAALEKSLAEAAVVKSGARTAPANAARSTGSPVSQTMASSDMLYASAEYQQLAPKLFASSLQLKYGPLYRKLGLSPQQIAEFESQLIELNQTTIDTFAVARSQGISVTDPSLARLNLTENNVAEGKFRQLLGDAGFNEYLAYNKNNAARSTTDSLAGSLYYTETPLTPAQGDELIRIIAANTPKLKVTGVLAQVAIPPDWDAVMAQAKGVLLPQQLVTLQALQEKAKLERQYSELYQKILREAAAAGNPPKG